MITHPMHTSMTRYGKRATFVALAVLALLLVGSIIAPAHAPHGAGPRTVKTVTLAASPFRPTATYAGFVRGINQVPVPAKISGYAVRLLREEGDSVKRGDTLAMLDGSGLTATRKAAVDALAATDRTYRDTEAYYDQKVDEARSAYDDARRHGTSDEADAADEAWRSAKRLRDTQVSAALAEKTSAVSGLDIADTAAADAVVRAPFDGIVTRRVLSLGSYVTPGMPIYEIASTDALEIPVSIPASVARTIAKGSDVVIGTDGARGQVFSIATAVGESTQSTVARVRFTAGADRFRPGDLAQVSFPAGPEREILRVPETAIIRVYEDTFVRIATDGIVSSRPVTVGDTDGSSREIRSGLEPGERIIVEGQSYVRDGDPITEIHETR